MGTSLVVAGPAGRLQSHARQMFQTELGPAASSFLPWEEGGKQGLSFCPGQLPGPGGGGQGTPSPSLGPAWGRSLLCGLIWQLGNGDGSVIPHPVASWAQEGHGPQGHCWATAVAEPGLVTDTVAQPKADRATQPAHGHTGHTWLHTHTHTHMHGHMLTHLHSQPQCHTVTPSQPRPHLPTPTCMLSVSATLSL